MVWVAQKISFFVSIPSTGDRYFTLVGNTSFDAEYRAGVCSPSLHPSPGPRKRPKAPPKAGGAVGTGTLPQQGRHRRA